LARRWSSRLLSERSKVQILEGTQKWIRRVVTTGMISSTTLHARVAQSVEHDLAKVRVASSNLVSRSIAGVAQLVERQPSKL
jgi:hypothetical protein